MNGHSPIAPWQEYQRLVLDELKRHGCQLDGLETSVATVRTDVAALKVKSGVWGLLGGLIPVLVLLLLEVLK